MIVLSSKDYRPTFENKLNPVKKRNRELTFWLWGPQVAPRYSDCRVCGAWPQPMAGGCWVCGRGAQHALRLSNALMLEFQHHTAAEGDLYAKPVMSPGAIHLQRKRVLCWRVHYCFSLGTNPCILGAAESMHCDISSRGKWKVSKPTGKERVLLFYNIIYCFGVLMGLLVYKMFCNHGRLHPGKTLLRCVKNWNGEKMTCSGSSIQRAHGKVIWIQLSPTQNTINKVVSNSQKGFLLD